MAGHAQGVSVSPIPAVDLQSVSRSIDGHSILSQVGVEARFGEFVGLVGPNGAGKTTLLNIIGGLTRAQSGTVMLAGADIARMSARAIARMTARLPQDNTLTVRFTGLEAVLMGRTPHLGAFAFESEHDFEIASDSMRRTETLQFARRIVTELSGGERQRVAVARALAQEPKVLLLDEPTANLDIGRRHQVMGLIRELTAEGIATIAAMHDLELAAEYCDRLVLLDKGSVVADGAPEHVLTGDNLARTYGVWAVCNRNPVTGRTQVVVLPNLAPHSADAPAVHVVAGGGAGAATMLVLRRAGFRVTACPLSASDSDAQAADALGIEFPRQTPFAPPDEAHMQAHRSMVAAASAVVVAPAPIGLGNLDNLRAAINHPRVVVVNRTGFADRDFAGGKATAILEAMKSRPVDAEVTNVAEAVARLIGAGIAAGGGA